MKFYVRQEGDAEADAVTIDAYSHSNAADEWCERWEEEAAEGYRVGEGLDSQDCLVRMDSEAKWYRFRVSGFRTYCYTSQPVGDAPPQDEDIFSEARP